MEAEMEAEIKLKLSRMSVAYKEADNDAGNAAALTDNESKQTMYVSKLLVRIQ